MKLKKFSVIILIISTALVSYRWYASYPPELILSSQETTTVNTFLQGMTTRCVGRYMIDIPRTFFVGEGDVLAFINDSPVKTKRLYRPAFEQKIRLREEALKNEKTINPQDLPFLKKVYPLPDGMDGIIFERNRSTSIPDSARVLEAHFYTNGVAIEIEMRARNGLSSRYDEDRKSTPEIYGNTVPEKLAELTQLLKRISGKKETEIPSQPGFCLPEVFIADGQSSQKEELDLWYTSPEYSSLSYNLSTDNFNKTDTTMLERNSEMEKAIKTSAGRTIQKGKRDLEGLYTEEWLVAGNIGDDEKGLRFIFQVNEKVPEPKKPWMYISFSQHGFGWSDQLSENEAVAVWEQITGTLRLRPYAFGK